MMRAAVAMTVLMLAACAPFQQGTREPIRTPSDRSEPAPGRNDGGVPTWPGQPVPIEDDDDLSLEPAWPRRAADVSGPAVASLVRQAETEMEAGRPDAAVAVLERAMRIEPRNAFVWAALAEGYLATDNAEQAETVAMRANSYARGNPWLEARNWATIGGAREAQGDGSGANDARARRLEALERQPPA